MTFAAPIASTAPVALPRAIGTLRVASKASPRGSAIDQLYQKGAYKAVFPRARTFTAVVVNTSGGITGGDRFDLLASAGAGSHLTLTTQAAERAYKALPGEVGQVQSKLQVEAQSVLHWLPQETIIFDGANVRRRLRCEVAAGASALIVEPMIFGRTAMGEDQVRGCMSDRIEIWQEGRLTYLDAWTLEGDMTSRLARPAIAASMGAMASLVLVGPQAEAGLEPLRALLPDTGAEGTGGASLKAPDILVARLLAKDGYCLRKSLLPILDHLTQNTLPTCWRL